MVVAGISPGSVRDLPGRLPLGRGSFKVGAERRTTEETAVAGASLSAISLLAVQEADSEAQQDREARRHGEQLLEELAALQRELLGSGEVDLGRLTRLVERPVTAADPVLARLLLAIKARAAVELARRTRA